MLSFALLEKRSMPLAGLPAYVARVPILAELNSRYFRMCCRRPVVRPSGARSWSPVRARLCGRCQ
jgi:hypothetical protein